MATGVYACLLCFAVIVPCLDAALPHNGLIHIAKPVNGQQVMVGDNGVRILVQVDPNRVQGMQEYAVYVDELFTAWYNVHLEKEYIMVPTRALGQKTIEVKLVDQEGEILEGGESQVQVELIPAESIESAKMRAENQASQVLSGNVPAPPPLQSFGVKQSVAEAVEEVTNYMNAFLKGDPDDPDDGSSFGSNRMEWMLMLARSPHVKTVCETGFNFGMSARAFLQWPHIEKVYSFDLMERAFKWRAQELLQRDFGPRLEVFAGPTRETLPKFIADHPNLNCDLVFIDGGHRGNDSEIDMRAFHQVSGPDTIVIADDCGTDTAISEEPGGDMAKQQLHDVWLSWKRMRAERLVQHLGSVQVCIGWPADYDRCYPAHFLCHGRYMPAPPEKEVQVREKFTNLIELAVEASKHQEQKSF